MLNYFHLLVNIFPLFWRVCSLNIALNKQAALTTGEKKGLLRGEVTGKDKRCIELSGNAKLGDNSLWVNYYQRPLSQYR